MIHYLQDLANLQKIYASVHDVDLIVGAISEKPKSDATVGVTLACIIGIYNFPNWMFLTRISFLLAASTVKAIKAIYTILIDINPVFIATNHANMWTRN